MVNAQKRLDFQMYTVQTNAFIIQASVYIYDTYSWINVYEHHIHNISQVRILDPMGGLRGKFQNNKWLATTKLTI